MLTCCVMFSTLLTVGKVVGSRSEKKTRIAKKPINVP